MGSCDSCSGVGTHDSGCPRLKHVLRLVDFSADPAPEPVPIVTTHGKGEPEPELDLSDCLDQEDPDNDDAEEEDTEEESAEPDEDDAPSDDDDESPTTCGMCGDILDDDEVEDLNGICYRCTNSHLKAIIKQQNDTNAVLLKKLREAHEEIGALKAKIDMKTFNRR